MTNTGRHKMSIREFINDLLGNSTDSVVIPLATKYGMIGGTATTALGWIFSAQGAIVIGVITTIGGFLVNYLYQRRRDSRHRYSCQQDEARKAELHAISSKREQVELEISLRQLERLKNESK